MRSYASGTSSSHPGFVVDFGWLGFGKHQCRESALLICFSRLLEADQDLCIWIGL